ncbi:MAG: GNAT family N-acetyltransferase [Anaerolineae bacterium]
MQSLPSSERIQLRPVTDDDLPIFFEHQRDPDAIYMAAFPPRSREAFMTHWAKIMVDPTVTLRTILYGEQIAGNIVSFEMFGQREVGYWIGKEFWGKGVATRALSAFLEIETTRPLYAHVAQRNIGSRRVLEKCGFTIIGIDKGLTDADDQPVDEYILRLDEHPL